MSVDVPQSRGLVGSARRALRVLEVVAAQGDGVSAKAVARKSGYTLSTTYHLLNTLVHDGYLVRLGHGRGFGLGYKLGPLFDRLCTQLDVDRLVRDELSALHQRVGAAVYYTVLRDSDVVVAAVADSPEHPRAQPVDFGFDEAAHATAYGKVLLAALPARRRREYLAGAGMPRLTERTTVRLRDLDRELEQVRHRGWAQDVEEFQPGLACVSAPVIRPDERVTAAIAFSVPLADFADRGPALHRHATEAATRLSGLLS